jgi:hypothetical protein
VAGSAAGNVDAGGTEDGSGGVAAAGGSPSSGGAGNAGSAGSGGSDPAGGIAGASGSGATGGAPLTRDVVHIAPDVVGASHVVADETYVFCISAGGGVQRVEHSGRAHTRVSEGPSYYLALDETHVYWSTQIDIRRMLKSGGPEEVVTRLKATGDNQPAAFWLAFDDAHVYASAFPNQPARAVVRAPKAGGAFEVVATRAEVGGVAVSDGVLFWADLDPANSIQRMDLKTGESASFHPGRASTMRILGENLWFRWLTEDLGVGPLVQVPLEGGEPILHSAAAPWVFFDNDATHIYWTSEHLMRINVKTGVEELVALVLEMNPVTVAVTREWLFVSGAGGTSNGGIFRIAKPAP